MNVHHRARTKPRMKRRNKQQQPPQKQDRQPGRESEMRPLPEYMPKFPGGGRLKDKVALITGGDSGIGRAVAVAMAREGAQIAIVYLEEHEDAEETVRLVEEEGSEAIKFAGDVGDEKFCEQVVERHREGIRPPRHPGEQRRRAARGRRSCSSSTPSRSSARSAPTCSASSIMAQARRCGT